MTAVIIIFSCCQKYDASEAIGELRVYFGALRTFGIFLIRERDNVGLRLF